MQTPSGTAVAGASIDVYNAGGVVHATIYSDDGITPVANPLTSASDGTFGFYVADGRYDLKVSGTGITTRTFGDVEIFDATEKNAGDGTIIATAANFTTLTVTGNQTVGGTLGVTGTSTVGASTVTGNETVGGTLQVTGATTLNSGTLNGTFGGNPTLSGNLQIGGTLGVTGTFNLGAISVTQVTNTGDELLSSGKVIKWNADTGLSRSAPGVLNVGNGAQGDVSGTIFAATAFITTIGTGTNGLVTFGGLGSKVGLSGGAGVLQIGNGTLNDVSGTLKLAALNNGGTLSLPTSTDTLVGKATTDTLTNKTLNGTGSGNAVTLLNTQGPTSALVGNSADQTIYTFTIPANTIQAGKGFEIKAVGFHSTGATATTYKIIIGSTTTATNASTSGNTANWSFSMYNLAGVQNSQYYEATAADGTTANMVNTFGNCAENFANAITVKFTFNVANTDQYTGKLWAVKLIQ